MIEPHPRDQIRAAVATGDTAWMRSKPDGYWGHGLKQMAVRIDSLSEEERVSLLERLDAG